MPLGVVVPEHDHSGPLKGGGTLHALELTTRYFRLATAPTAGWFLGSDAAGVGTWQVITAGAIAVPEFADNVFRIIDDVTPSKKLAFQCSGIGSSTTITWTVQNQNGTVPLLQFANNWTASQQFAVGIQCDDYHTNTTGPRFATTSSDRGLAFDLSAISISATRTWTIQNTGGIVVTTNSVPGGSIIYGNSSGVGFTALVNGTVGQVLTSGGTTVAPTWSTPAADVVDFADNTFRVHDDGDVSRLLALQCSGITTGNTRTWTVQDADGTVPLLERAQTFTRQQQITPNTDVNALTLNVANTNATDVFSIINSNSGGTILGVALGPSTDFDTFLKMGRSGTSQYWVLRGGTVPRFETSAGRVLAVLNNVVTYWTDTKETQEVRIGDVISSARHAALLGNGGAVLDRLAVVSNYTIFGGETGANIQAPVGATTERVRIYNGTTSGADARVMLRVETARTGQSANLVDVVSAVSGAATCSIDNKAMLSVTLRSTSRIADDTDRTRLLALDVSALTSGTKTWNVKNYTGVPQVPTDEGTSGQVLTSQGAGVQPVWGTGATSFADNVFRITDDATPSKQLAFQCSGIAPSTTRTVTAQNADLTMAGTDVAQTFTKAQTILPDSDVAGLVVKGFTSGGSNLQEWYESASGSLAAYFQADGIFSIPTQLSILNSGFSGIIKSPTLTASRTWTMLNLTGTVPLFSGGQVTLLGTGAAGAIIIKGNLTSPSSGQLGVVNLAAESRATSHTAAANLANAPAAGFYRVSVYIVVRTALSAGIGPFTLRWTDAFGAQTAQLGVGATIGPATGAGPFTLVQPMRVASGSVTWEIAATGSGTGTYDCYIRIEAM